MVAVKRFIHNVKENFAKELIVHREINHKNVVRLIGCCEEENALMLVTEYVANGNLSDILHDDNLPIPLDVRLTIAIECAEALAYMHSHMYTQVIHGDVKPGNILLDSNFHAKLSDFGISRLANTDKTLHTKNVIGSIGYMDPLFALDGRLTVKYDVYSFGVVLLELMARKKATTVVDNVSIVYAFTSALARGSGGVRWMFDAEIIASKDNMKVVEGVAKIAGECLTIEREKRPEMIDVVERLRVLRQKASRQDQASQRSGLFSWARKNKAAPPASANIPANILPSDLRLPQFSFADIKAATNKFDESLRVGCRGSVSVYRGKIAGTKVAIKCLHLRYSSTINEFHNEIQMMSKHRHCPHLVPLLGYCTENDMLILVYEYMDRGSLFEHLGTEKPPFTWKQCIEICIAAARGLCYLHEQRIIHGNVNTKKILLDEKWIAKIADLSHSRYGPSREDTTRVRGTAGYLDHEYMVTGQMTEKSDVCSFGAVLFKVLNAWRAHQQTGLSRRALRFEEEGNLDQIIDQCSFDKIAKTAEKCVVLRGIDCPSMANVVSDLEGALPSNSFPTSEYPPRYRGIYFTHN
ncbi:wall-associated receptor kinase 1-like [Panicum virgatum]|uniref:Protein kinase domain-containing protein n=1 Tax=Panicum virgatum TaxID=38727 RepID=A0A8T0MWA2_PANVG|nr:wall-associated receptor kinase 1-like [Panicum virgatum]KAG2540392.1 hypothetical protein PVAP13_9NG551370 [Panicum virgatum]